MTRSELSSSAPTCSFTEKAWARRPSWRTNDVCYGMARMYQILAEPDGISVGVFRTVADAERWLVTERPSST